MRRALERVVLMSRWLLVPLYLGLAAVVLLLVVRFFAEVAHLVPQVLADDGAHLTVAALTLIDLVLVASLVVMVMLSGFDTFVARIDLGEDQEGLTRLTRLEQGSIKVRIVSGAAVISAIYLLEAIFDIKDYDKSQLFSIASLHLALVATAVLFAVLDRVEKH